MSKINVGIVGAAGYTGGELIRILLNHPHADIDRIQSSSNAGNHASAVHHDLVDTELSFSDSLNSHDVIFLCSGHGKSREYLESNDTGDARIIDLSQDYRLDDTFVYGLPEVNREEIKAGSKIANPGCFATAIQLGLLPAIKEGVVRGEIHTSAITGSTGAGFSPSATTHFSWRSNNISIYKAFEHQHLNEIGRTFNLLGGFEGAINFIPYRGPFTRGIIASSYFDYDGDLTVIEDLYKSYYSEHPFTLVVDTNPDIKQVINTNKCLVNVSVARGKAHIITVIDNLVKGASGQAVQNMNLMMGLEENLGLNLKASAF